MHINGLRFPKKVPYFLIYNNKIRICQKSLSTVPEFRLFQLLLKRHMQMAPFLEKGGILTFFFFYYVYDMKFIT